MAEVRKRVEKQMVRLNQMGLGMPPLPSVNVPAFDTPAGLVPGAPVPGPGLPPPQR